MRMPSTSGSARDNQANLADKLAVSRPTMNALKTEKNDPSLPLATKIARLVKKPIEEIFELDADCGIDIPV